jgi:insulysin
MLTWLQWILAFSFALLTPTYITQTPDNATTPSLSPSYPPCNMTVPFQVIESSVDKPVTDDRQYRVITLANGLEALLIHDPDADRASAAMDVNVGSFSDPVGLPGLAHFCEHLLFMGTEKYPEENDYSTYLSEHSGSSNAYTASEETNYFFDVGHEYLEGAFDRFAQFFVAPLFAASAKDREIQAVDSENKKNLQNDMWRLFQLERSLSNPDHPYNRFSTGNYETLHTEPLEKGMDVREELLKFYKASYSSNIMKLVILGRESLDTLQSWVVEKLSSVVNTNATLPDYGVPLLTEGELGTLVKAKPIMDTKSIEVTFPVPDTREHWESHPGHYYSHLVGHEGPGSILFFLKNKGWVSSCSSGAVQVCRGAGVFTISCELTDAGMNHYKDVVVHIFEYLRMLRDEPVQEWIYDEMRDVALANFRFRQKENPSSTTSRLATVLQKNHLPRQYLLSSSLFRKYSPEVIQAFGRHFTTDNFKIFLVGQELEGLNQTEKWYGTQYSNDKIDADWMRRVKSAGRNPDLHLPAPNEFIPTDFSVPDKRAKEPQTHPTLLRNTDYVRLWHKRDDTFLVPKATVRIRLKNPIGHADPFNSVKTTLLIEVVTDLLLEFAYAAEIAGLKYGVLASRDGVEIDLNGYNHKLETLLERILLKIKNFDVDQSRFNIVKETVSKTYKNFGYNVPYAQVAHHSQYLLNDHTWTVQEKREKIEQLTREDIISFVPEFLRHLQVETLVVGNLAKEDAVSISQTISNVLKPAPLSPSQLVNPRSFLLPDSSAFHYDVDLEDKANVNSVIDYMVQVGKFSNIRTRALLEVLAQIGQEPSFNQLRTKEQLGYVVFSGIKSTRTTLLYRVLIQSEKSCSYLESRIENYLIEILGPMIRNMSEAEFDKHVAAVVAKKLEKRKNISEEASRYWSQIISGYYDFKQNFKDAEEIKTLKKADLVEFYDRYVDPASKLRSKLVINLKSQVTKDEGQIPNSVPIIDHAAFKNSLSMTEAPVPVEDLKNYMDPKEKL